MISTSQKSLGIIVSHLKVNILIKKKEFCETNVVFLIVPRLERILFLPGFSFRSNQIKSKTCLFFANELMCMDDEQNTSTASIVFLISPLISAITHLLNVSKCLESNKGKSIISIMFKYTDIDIVTAVYGCMDLRNFLRMDYLLIIWELLYWISKCTTFFLYLKFLFTAMAHPELIPRRGN